MKIGFFSIEPQEKEVLKGSFPNDKLFFCSQKLSSANLKEYKQLEVISSFVNSVLCKSILEKFPNLKLIATRSTGFDHIDLDYCQKKNITVCNVPSYGENTVAEHTFALILTLSRRILESVGCTRGGVFEFGGLRGFDLKGKTLGVIGGGKIGQNVIKIAGSFGMEIIVFDVVKNQKLAKDLGFSYVSLDKLFGSSDIITLHVPYNNHTHHLIDNKAVNKMKKGVYIINTSRGAVIDTKALVKGLESKKVAGAGLDVLEEEKKLKEESKLVCQSGLEPKDIEILLEDHVLLKMPNVVVTPHNAFNTKEALERILQTTIKNIKSFKKKKLINKVK